MILCIDMRSLLAIRCKKTVVNLGSWRSGQKMPRSAFSLSKSHSYALGSSYSWCVCEVEGEGDRFRLLVGFDPLKEQYRAWLGLIDGSDTALLARLEFHPSHSGWHFHWELGPIASVVRGVVKEPKDRDRIRRCNTPDVFAISELDALGVAFRVFNVVYPPKQGELFS
jgi:hypothetical protein